MANNPVVPRGNSAGHPSPTGYWGGGWLPAAAAVVYMGQEGLGSGAVVVQLTEKNRGVAAEGWSRLGAVGAWVAPGSTLARWASMGRGPWVVGSAVARPVNRDGLEVPTFPPRTPCGTLDAEIMGATAEGTGGITEREGKYMNGDLCTRGDWGLAPK